MKNKDLNEIITSSLGLDTKSSEPVLTEAVVLTVKEYTHNTEALSNKTKNAHYELYQNYIKQFNNISAQLDVIDMGEQGDLPDWFYNNNWHHLIYLAYASGESLPGDTTDTTPADGIPDNACKTLGTQCLVLNNSGTPSDDKRALAMIAGGDLTASRPSGNFGDYFENQNATPQDDNFWKGQATAAFNDQIKVISVSP